MTTKALVGPLPTVRFYDGTRIVADPPRNTLDPRFIACTDHHLACDCREAEMNESLSEYREMYLAVEKAAREILNGHATKARRRDPFTDEMVELSCQCTGCQIARAAHLWGGGYL